MLSRKVSRVASGIGILGAMCLLGVNQASAKIITLELNLLPSGSFTGPLTINGFTLTPQLGGSSIPTIINDGGTYVLGSTDSVFAGGADTFLTKNDGGTFSILSVQVAALNGDSGNFALGIGVVGGSGKTYGSRFGSPLTPALQTFDTSTFIQNAKTVDLDPVNTGDGDVIGNIVISYTTTAVPEPASLLVVGLGVAGLFFGRRSRKAS